MVAAQSTPAEREFATGPGRLTVPINDAGTDLVNELLITVFVATEKSCRESVRCIVGFRDGGIKIFDANDVEQRTEQFFIASIGNFRHVDQTG